MASKVTTEKQDEVIMLSENGAIRVDGSLLLTIFQGLEFIQCAEQPLL